MKKFLCMLLMVTACCSQEDVEVLRSAQHHAEKLRNHFIGRVPGDTSALVAETQIISSNLKRLKFNVLANKFDSYLDVLMYGNRTLQESVEDVQELIYGGVCECDYQLCINSSVAE